MRVVLADDHAMVRHGMAEMLSTDPGMEVVGQAENGREAVDLAREEKPDVVVLDVEMPVMGGQVALRKLLDLSPPPGVVIVTVFADRSNIRELLGLGASAFLSKNAPMRTLLDTVRSVASSAAAGDREGRGGDDVMVSVPRTSFEGGGTGETGLTGREAEVLLRAARGEGNRRIAEGLHLSETTVKRHLSNVYGKLGVHTRGEATQKALSEGWISAWDVSREE